MHIDHISNSVIMSNDYVSLLSTFLHSHTSEENGVANEAIVHAWVTGLKRLVRHWSCEKVMDWCTAQCKMLLFCAKTVMQLWTLWLYDNSITSTLVFAFNFKQRERGFEHARLVSSTLWSLQKCEKRLLSVKCCCFVQKPSYIQFWTKKRRRKRRKRRKTFLVYWYTCDAFSHHQESC